MKNLLLILPFLIVGCAVEEDTKLICDCDFVVEDLQKEQCYSSSYDVNNNSLVFNVSKKKFAWNGNEISGSPETFVEFGEDSIKYFFDSGSDKTLKQFDRVNLRFKEHRERVIRVVDGVQIFALPKITHYQCRIVKGV